VLAVGDVCLIDGSVGVGEERVIPPEREQRVGKRASLTRRTKSFGIAVVMISPVIAGSGLGRGLSM